ncbi:MAG TPA: hypothetical protein VJ901_13150 [Thermoanaerobaculia bacterium]|nr:hypothetical protein [Thermoanaerobaculia bacterium]
MPQTAIQNLPDDARVWVFGISPALDEAKSAQFLNRIDSFLAQWAAHGNPITSSRDLIEGSFLVIGVDRDAETSGCSIDRMFGTLKQLESELGVQILDPNRVFFRHGDGHVDATSRAGFSDRGDAHTVVFDTIVERLGEIRSGRWEKRAEQSWHRQLLRAS